MVLPGAVFPSTGALRKSLDQLRRTGAGVVRRGPRSERAGSLADRLIGDHLLDGTTNRTGGDKTARQTHAAACPGDAGGVLVHVTGDRTGDDGAAAGEGAHERAMAGVTNDDIARRHCARVGDPIDEVGVGRNRQRTRGKPAVPRREDSHGRASEAAKGRVKEPVVRVLGGGGGDEHKRIVARREGDLLRRGLPYERSDDMGIRGP